MSESKVVTMETTKGVIRFEVFEDKAPLTVMNFLHLVNEHFYDGLTFHRYVPVLSYRVVIRWETEPRLNKKIKLEIHPDLKHTEGAVAMARSQNPDSASCQFYITLAPQPSLDGSYAVFGQVISGMDVVLSLREGDKMTSVKVND